MSPATGCWVAGFLPRRVGRILLEVKKKESPADAGLSSLRPGQFADAK
jgi:hypothetical protein